MPANTWRAAALQADIILLDGYDAEGLPSCLCAESFYANCWQALSAQGVLVANLWGGEPNRGVYLNRLRGIFDGRVWWSKPRDSSNLIVFAVKNRALLSAVVAPDVEGANPGQALSAGSAVGGQQHAAARGSGRLNNYSFIRTFRHVSLFYSEKTFPETG